MTSPRLSPLLVLVVALLGISASGPLVRLSSAPAIAIAVWRLGLSLVVVAVALAVTGSWRELRRLRAGDLAIALGAANRVRHPDRATDEDDAGEEDQRLVLGRSGHEREDLRPACRTIIGFRP